VIVGETCRFYTSFLAAKKLLDDGRLGELVWVDAWYVHQISDSLFDITPWRLSEPQDFLYGGVCHPMDTVIWVLGDAEEVHCMATKSGLAPRYPLPENFLISVKTRSGKMARVAGSYGVVQPPYPMMGLGLHGTCGTAVADFTDFETSSLRVRLSSEVAAGSHATEEARTMETATRIEYTYPVDMEGAYGQGLAVRRYMRELEAAITEDRRPSLGAWEGAKTIAALEACAESIKTGKPEKVPSLC